MLENDTVGQSHFLLQKQSNHFKVVALNIGQFKSLETGLDQQK